MNRIHILVTTLLTLFRMGVAAVQVTFTMISPDDQILEVGSGSPPLLLGVYQTAILADRCIIAADKLDNTVKVFDDHGILQFRFGHPGRGVGEFRGPASVAASAELIAVGDFASHRIQFFDGTGKFQRALSAPGPVLELGMDARGLVWAAVVPENTDQTLIRFNIDGSIQSEIRLNNSGSDLFSSMVTFAVGTNGIVVAGYRFRNLIEVWDTSGRSVSEFRVAALPPRPPMFRISRGWLADPFEIPEETIINNVALDESGDVYVLAGTYSINPNRDVYRLDAGGRLKGVLVLPEESHQILIRDRVLFAVTTERNRIRGYTLDPPKKSRSLK